MTAPLNGAAPSALVYLVHFNQPYPHAPRYAGWHTDLKTRLGEHQAGRGAGPLQVITQAGIEWTLARTWAGTRALQLERQGGTSRRCPICQDQKARAQ
jgi:predicted GIY-YIG superfamily endonuclease